MQMCPFCDKVYDESEYSRCPYFAEGKYRNASDECMNTMCTLHEFCMNTNGKMTPFVYYEYYDLDTRVFLMA